jgi:site-specific DNA-methyltransferase (adenine-specific)
MVDVRLFCGDCLDIMPTLDGPFDAIIADLPYGTTACKWDTVIPFEPLWTQYKRLIKPRGAIVLFGSQPFTSALVMSNPKWYQYELIWEKDKASNFAVAKYRMLKYHENLSVFFQEAGTYNPQMWDAGRPCNTPGANGGMSGNTRGDVYGRSAPLRPNYEPSNLRYPKSIIRVNTLKHNDGEYAAHPTQKPVALLEYLVRTYTNEGETVLDNTMGSGTTGVACVKTGRSFVGIDIVPEYVDIAEKRIGGALEKAKQPQQLRLKAAQC